MLYKLKGMRGSDVLVLGGTSNPCTKNIAFSFQPSRTGGIGPYVFSIASGTLPTGLSLNTTTGLITGTPTVSAPSTLTLRVTDALATVVDRVFDLSVYDPLVITGTPETYAILGTAYSFVPGTTGGRGAKTFTYTGTPLPAGVSFNTSTGAITGTPTLDGVLPNVQIVAQDADNRVSAAFSYVLTVTQNVSVSAIPGGLWNGTPASGYAVVPAATYTRRFAAVSGQRARLDRPRVTGNFITPSGQSMAGADMIVVVYAYSPGGITKVTLHAEGNDYDNTVGGLHRVPNSDGSFRIREGYAFKIPYASWNGFLSGNGADLYATVVSATPATYDNRIIGPLRIMPTAVAHDFTIYVSSDNTFQDGSPVPVASATVERSATLTAAFTALQARGTASRSYQGVTYLYGVDKHPRFVLCKSITHDIGTQASDGTARSEGWLTIEAGPGATAIIGRTSPPDYELVDTTAWSWRVPWARMRLKGRNPDSDPGLIIDHTNFSGFRFGGVGGVSPPFAEVEMLWLDRCTQDLLGVTPVTVPTTKLGTNYSPSKERTPYWNKASHPGVICGSNQIYSLPVLATGNRINYLSGITGNLIDGTVLNHNDGNPFGRGTVIMHTHVNYQDNRWRSDQNPLGSIIYTGAATSATIEKAGTSGGVGAGSAVVLKHDGVTVRTIEFVNSPGKANAGTYKVFTAAEFETAIESVTGWAMALLSSSDFWAIRFIQGIGFGSTQAFDAVECKNTTRNFVTSPDIHTEWIQESGVGGVNIHEENCVRINNSSTRSTYGTAAYSLYNGLQDSIVANMFFDWLELAVSSSSVQTGSNLTWLNNWAEDTVLFNPDPTNQTTNGLMGSAQSLVAGNLWRAISTQGGVAALFLGTLRDNVYTSDVSGYQLDIDYGITNKRINISQYNALFVSKAAGNFIPASNSLLRSSLVSSPMTYDINGVRRNTSSDWAGPWSKETVSMTWPVFG